MFEIVMGIDDFLIQLVKYCIGTTANQGWTYYTQRFYMNDHGNGDSIRFYVDGTPNSGASFYIDAITLTPDMAGIAATETRDNTH